MYNGPEGLTRVKTEDCPLSRCSGDSGSCHLWMCHLRSIISGRCLRSVISGRPLF